jgi:YidC/Oxa1 family membrane protein insertase
MDRNTVLRWIVIAGAILLFWKFGLPLITGKKEGETQSLPPQTFVNAPDFVPDTFDPLTGDQKTPWQPQEGELCTLEGPRYEATLSTRGAALTHFMLRDAQYAGSNGFDMVTTEHERWRPLRTWFRGKDADSQVKYDRFNWKLEKMGDGSGCRFTYQDDDVQIVKTVTPSSRPFELDVDVVVTNRAKEPRKHAFGIGDYAFRFNKEMKGSLGRVPPFQTEVSCAKGKEITRKGKDDFKTGWLTVPGVDRYAAVSNYYFAQAVVPESGATPDCRIVAEEVAPPGVARDADDAGFVFHADLDYPAKELAPGQSATYKLAAYFGPKERNVLATAAGGRAGLGDLINLGFFSPIAKFLVGVLVYFHDHITFGNWGVAIILMTICLRVLLFPLALQAIKASLGMRKLKPELDAINKKFADDAQAKHLATMELWRKHGVNPLGGCLPQLVQMPIWFAMYTTLQTAVEMYHTKFLWFSDLSAPDRFFILPFVLGGFMIVQQRIVPTTGMDPVQQKMMMYMLPAVFTVMMLFLPAALGVYMLTNSSLYIVQQLGVEAFAKRRGLSAKKSEITVKEVGDTGKKKEEKPPAFGKGKARV